MVSLKDHIEMLTQTPDGRVIEGVHPARVDEIERLIREDERKAVAENRRPEPDEKAGWLRMRAPPHMSGQVHISSPPGPTEPYELPNQGGVLRVHPHHVRNFEKLGFVYEMTEEEKKAQTEADEKAEAAAQEARRAQDEIDADVRARSEAAAAAAQADADAAAKAQADAEAAAASKTDTRTRRQVAADERRAATHTGD